LTHLSFLFNISLSKDILLSLHLTNIVIHIANSLLVSLLCSQLLSLTHADFNRTRIGFLAGLLFSVHPVNSQAIIYISQRATLLATFFYLATIILYLLFREKKKRPYQIVSLLTCFLAMSCKEISITLPITLILLHFALIEKNLKQAIRSCFPYILLLFLIPLYYRYHAFVVSSNIKQPDYFITQIRVALTYIRLFFLPTSLRLEYDYPIYTSLLNSQILIALSFFASFFYFSILFVKKMPLLLSAGIFFLLTLAPDSSFVALNDVIFEHRFYLPSVLIFCVFSQSLFLLFKKKLLRTLVILVVVSCYCYLTFNRAKEWSNPIILFENDIRLSPKNDRSYVNLGHYFLTVGDLSNAKKWFEKTLIVNPNNARAHNNLGMMAKDQRLFDEAFVHFQRALK
jgi:tetratricopeptide (TPR) repeat protein